MSANFPSILYNIHLIYKGVVMEYILTFLTRGECYIIPTIFFE